MSAVLILAGKEVRDALRNRWVASATLLLAGLAVALAFLGSAPVGAVGAKPLAVTVVSLSSLTIFLVPLIALLLAYDTIVGESERGTMMLLLTHPVSRPQILVGKFLGHLAVIAIATVLGYGAAGIAVGLGGDQPDPDGWRALAGLVGSAVLLGGVFVALGMLASVLVRERSTAAGIAIGLWLLFVVIYDLGLLGGLVASHGKVNAHLFPYLLLLNPADVFRLFNLTGFDGVRSFSGMAGLSGVIHFPVPVLLAVLAAWMAVPLGTAMAIYARREP